MKVEIDKEGCIACGLCAELCPSVFELDDEGLAFVKEQPSFEVEEMAKEVAESCPVSVIFIRD